MSGGGALRSAPVSREIPAIVRATADDDLLRDALMENLHRQQLNPLEEAAAYQQLLDDFGATHEELARRIGRSRPHISNTLRLAEPPRRGAAPGRGGGADRRATRGRCWRWRIAEAQDHLAHRIVAEGLSVRAVEEIVTMGVRPAKERRPVARQPSPPALNDLADRLSDAFDTRVKVELGKRKGKIVVEFGSLEDLERIVSTMSPDWSGSLSA